jgi:hypothetical protein
MTFSVKSMAEAEPADFTKRLLAAASRMPDASDCKWPYGWVQQKSD